MVPTSLAKTFQVIEEQTLYLFMSTDNARYHSRVFTVPVKGQSGEWQTVEYTRLATSDDPDVNGHDPKDAGQGERLVAVIQGNEINFSQRMRLCYPAQNQPKTEKTSSFFRFFKK